MKIGILVVEDERIVSMDLQRRLKTMGYDVVGAASLRGRSHRKGGIPTAVVAPIMLVCERAGRAEQAANASYAWVLFKFLDRVQGGWRTF